MWGFVLQKKKKEADSSSAEEDDFEPKVPLSLPVW
jgi:hypothetical protein